MCRPSLLATVAVALVVVVLGVPEAAGQTVTCPEPKTKANFDAEKYLGSWYEMKRVPRSFEDDGECGMAQYSWFDQGKTAINVLNTNYVPKTSEAGSVTLRATPDDLPNGKLSVTFPNLPNVPASKYWVLDTDYEKYAVVYSCQAQAGAIVPHVTLWVLARSPDTYTAAVDKTAMAVIQDVGLDPSILKTVQHHTGCPSTTCKPCPTPKNNLDLTKLKGLWSEVQHSPYSTGSDKQSCSLAEFSATSDGVKLSATTYEVSAADGSGADKTMELQAKWTDASKKDGSFNINSSDGKICVLDTDYDNWLVMSICVPPTPATTAAPVGPVASGAPTASGGVFVLSRKRGLTPTQQFAANKVVVNAGIPAASMQTTTTTPCPAAALAGNSATSAMPTAVLLLCVLVVGLFRPTQ